MLLPPRVLCVLPRQNNNNNNKSQHTHTQTQGGSNVWRLKTYSSLVLVRRMGGWLADLGDRQCARGRVRAALTSKRCSFVGGWVNCGWSKGSQTRALGFSARRVQTMNEIHYSDDDADSSWFCCRVVASAEQMMMIVVGRWRSERN